MWLREHFGTFGVFKLFLEPPQASTTHLSVSLIEHPAQVTEERYSTYQLFKERSENVQY